MQLSFTYNLKSVEPQKSAEYIVIIQITSSINIDELSESTVISTVSGTELPYDKCNIQDWNNVERVRGGG